MLYFLCVNASIKLPSVGPSFYGYISFTAEIKNRIVYYQFFKLPSKGSPCYGHFFHCRNKEQDCVLSVLQAA